MYIKLNEKTAKMVEKLALDLGFTIGEMVNQILVWYFEDCEKENNM
jgi:hypothetical protein